MNCSIFQCIALAWHEEVGGGSGLPGCKSNDWQTISKFPANPTSYEDEDDADKDYFYDVDDYDCDYDGYDHNDDGDRCSVLCFLQVSVSKNI